MSMNDSHRGFSASDGRRFGTVVGAAFLALGTLFWWKGHMPLATAAWTLGGLLVVAGLVIPGRLGPVWRAWMGLARAISKVTTPIVMGLVYFLVITPSGFVLRLVSANPLGSDGERSYWKKRTDGGARQDMRRQF